MGGNITHEKVTRFQERISQRMDNFGNYKSSKVPYIILLLNQLFAGSDTTITFDLQALCVD
jgi:hypothetical protein